MAYSPKVLVKSTTTTPGTGTYTIGAASSGYRSFSVITDGDTVPYMCKDASGNFERGVGTKSGGGSPTLARTTIVESSNAGAAVNWGVGTRDIYVIDEANGNLAASNNLSDVASADASRQNLKLAPAGQSGGTNGKVVRLTSANTWVDAANTDTADQLQALAFKIGGAYLMPGQIITGLSSLTPAATYYLSTSGDITSTAPTASASVRLVKIGKAYSTTALLFQPEWPAIDGTALNIPVTKRVTADIGYTSTTLANVTGLSFDAAAGETRTFTARLYLSASAVGGYKAAIGGTATATAITYRGQLMVETATSFAASGKATSLGTAICQVASGVEDAYLEIHGTITVANAGTLTVQFAQNTASGTTTVRRGSTFISAVVP